MKECLQILRKCFTKQRQHTNRIKELPKSFCSFPYQKSHMVLKKEDVSKVTAETHSRKAMKILGRRDTCALPDAVLTLRTRRGVPLLTGHMLKFRFVGISPSGLQPELDLIKGPQNQRRSDEGHKAEHRELQEAAGPSTSPRRATSLIATHHSALHNGLLF